MWKWFFKQGITAALLFGTVYSDASFWAVSSLSIRTKEAHAAITYESAGDVTNNALISGDPTYPDSIAEGDLLVLLVGQKPSSACSGSVPAPEGWVAVTSTVGDSGYSCAAPGADTGDTNVFSFYKIAEGTESGDLIMRLVTNNSSWTQIYRFTNATGDWDVAGTTGVDTSGDSSVSITMLTDPGVTTGDHILGAMVIPTDITTPNQFSSEALSQTGVTFDTVTEINEFDTGNGNDLGGFAIHSSVVSGTSSAAPVMTATAGGTTTNVIGRGLFVRVRATGTITYESAGAIDYPGTASGAAICPTHPASVVEDDILVTLIGMKPDNPNSGSATTSTGWTAITSLTGAGGYGTELIADRGNTNVFSYYKVAKGTEQTEICFALIAIDAAWAQIFRFSNDSNVWSVAGATGSDESGDSSVSITMSSDPGVTTGDHIIGAMVIPTDTSTPNQFSSQAFSQTGVTFDTVTEISEPDITTGNDLGGFTIQSSVSSGIGSAAPVMTATAGGFLDNVRGPGIFIRIRETPPTYTQQAYRFFANANGTDVGSALATQSNAATLDSAGDAFRLRMLLRVDTADLHASGQDFKLQFAEKSGTCDTGFSGESYADVTGATVIAYEDNASPADGANLTANANDPTDGGRTIVNQDYEEANNFTNSVAAIPSGQDGKWDFALVDNGATADTAYCFRMVESDGTLLSVYTAIPEVVMAGGGAVYSVSITSSGTISYGFVQIGTSTSTVSGGGTQIAQNDGNATEKLNVKSSNATGGTTWTLASSIGTNQFTHEFSTTTGSVWVSMPDADTYVTAVPSLAESATSTFDFRLTVPNATSDYQEKSITITVQAVAP